jgi:hypothetical protein
MLTALLAEAVSTLDDVVEPRPERHWSGEIRSAKAPAQEVNNSVATQPSLVKLYEHLQHHDAVFAIAGRAN